MLDDLKYAIRRTVIQFQKYPYDFLSERDIQAVLFVELRNALRHLLYTYELNDQNKRFGFNEPIPIHPVTTEYFLSDGKQDRFDIAVLSEDQDRTTAIWRQPCRIAIEIKLWQPGYKDCSYRRDVKKLQGYQSYLHNHFSPERKFTGIAMLFVHPCAKVVLPPETSLEAYPGNGIALHFVTRESHWCQNTFTDPPIPEQAD